MTKARHSFLTGCLHVLTLSSVLLAFEASAGVMGPSNYNECILENIKGGPSTLATQEIKNACARQFPKTVPLDDIDLIIRIIDSGELMSNAHYKAVHEKYYADIDYEEYLRRVFAKKDRMKYRDISFEQFLKLIEYKR